jgi:elongation factor G
MVERGTSDDCALSAYCFKTTVDPFIGTISYIKVFSGTLESGQRVVVSNTGDEVKINQLTLLRGKEQLDVEKLHAGDIGVVTKIDELFTGCTIADPKDPVVINGPEIPGATIYTAIHPRNKKDEDKISTALHKIAIEDPSFEFKRNRETAQLLIGGQGMSHINMILEKLKDVYKVDVDTSDPKVVYRETIKKTAEAEGRHKKQSGGSGQFGVVKIRFEPMDPNEKDFEFAEEIHGGSVPRGYWPAVEKGLIEHFTEGPLAGFPVIGVRAVLYDGQYHSVDSNEISFKLAAALAFKNALKDLKPTILEPIMRLEITIRDEYVGDVMGDINKRRGQVQGMEPLSGGKQKIVAEVPESEIVSYTIDLRAMTQGTGIYKRQFVRYEEVPNHMINEIIAEYTKED